MAAARHYISRVLLGFYTVLQGTSECITNKIVLTTFSFTYLGETLGRAYGDKGVNIIAVRL